MTQILFIHGGESYSSYDTYITNLRAATLDYDRLIYRRRWRDWIADQLTPEYAILTPTFPNGSNAQYDEWVIYFEKILPFLQDGSILVGHSLGAMFLAKYLHTHTLPFRARRIILIAAQHGACGDETDGSFVVDSASGIEHSCDEVHLFHSEDDPVVPYGSLHAMANDIPEAIIHSYTDQAHFSGSTFPDLLALLQQK